MTVRVTVTMPDEVLAVLDQIAEAEDVSRSDVVREAAERYVASRSAEAAACERHEAVEEGLIWLEELASAESPEAASSLELLRDLRGSDEEAIGRPIDSIDDDPGIP
jgi:predicted transcriptional regulator